MLSFEEIEDCMPDGSYAAIDDNGTETGYVLVSAQWLHDFAHAVAAKEREACAAECELIADNGSSTGEVRFSEVCAKVIRERSNVELRGAAQ